ncbi:hypothetical protein G5I_05089 [Acromyrmex echinatior]|uniref:Uncharacterized protein n=1 Tax=Acromyrmex echinatior TaxID=103372 RepID=F4WHC9_ACREC|nr:hypothetical protein G5I_05089 [Acromyrmex echinatior]
MLSRCKNLISRNAGEYFCTFAVTRLRRERAHYVSRKTTRVVRRSKWRVDDTWPRCKMFATIESLPRYRPGLKRRIAAIFHVRTKYRFAGDCKQKYDLGTCSPPSARRRGPTITNLRIGGANWRGGLKGCASREIAEGAPPPLTLMRL